MAQRDPTKPQLDFPQLVADIIRQLRLTGQVGLLEFSDQVMPVYIVAQRAGALALTSEPPAFDSAEIFSGTLTNPVAGAVAFDTGALPVGVYDMAFGISTEGIIADSDLELQWRNAANAANLAVWPTVIGSSDPVANTGVLGNVSINIGLNERLRLVNIIATGGRMAGWLMLALRPTP